jgi:hypothetical protein
MQNEENTNENQVETQEVQEEVVEETTAEQVAEVTQSETPVDDTEARLAKAEADAAKYRRLFEKTQKPNVEKQKVTSQASPLNVEEAVLLAQGMPEDLITSLKKVAQVEGIGSLIKAQTNPIFVAVKEKYEKDQKQKQSSMPASRGAGQVKVKKDISSPGLSRDEHKAMLEEMLGR